MLKEQMRHMQAGHLEDHYVYHDTPRATKTSGKGKHRRFSLRTMGQHLEQKLKLIDSEIKHNRQTRSTTKSAFNTANRAFEKAMALAEERIA